MFILYNLFILPIIKFILPLLKIFNTKLAERENSWKASVNDIMVLKQNNGYKKKIWFHSASMGEFEQVKPVIEKLKLSDPNLTIICSFFSPSGYNNQRNYKFADAVVYLPFDFRKNVYYFLNVIKPDIAVFVRYEIWYNYLVQLEKLKIPCILIAATQPGIRNPIIKFLSKQYYKQSFLRFDEIFTVNQTHSNYFIKYIGCKNVTTASDTRYDRIIQYIEQHSSENNLINDLRFSEIKEWLNQVQKSFRLKPFIFVAGSTWLKDEILISDAIKSGKLSNASSLILIIVPHEPSDKNVKSLKQLFDDAILFSSISNTNKANQLSSIIDHTPSTLIIDSVGMLLGIYKYANVVYIGGGFGAGVHSVAEPAGYGLPLASGPAINNSNDALNLHQLGSLKVIKNTTDLIEWLNIMSTELELRRKLGKQSADYIFKQAGSTEIISKRILDLIKNQPPS